jgi:hypothetical protein
MYKLGKKAARHAISFKLENLVNTEALPPLPAVFGHVNNHVVWGELGNNECGDCVWAGAAHETMAYALAQHRKMPVFDTQTVVAQYSEQTGYNPDWADMDGVNPSDQGTDMQSAASYRRKTGLLDAAGVRHQITAYAAIPVGRGKTPLMLLYSAYLFGACGLGLQLPASAMDQFDKGQPWSVVRGSPNEGGHYVPVLGRNSRGNVLIVTWGRIQAVTQDFIHEYMDEGVAYFSKEYLNAEGISPEMFDSARLASDLKTVGA